MVNTTHKEKSQKFIFASGYNVWRWPEFIAFAERLGVVLSDDVQTTNLIIDIPHDGLTKITQEFRGIDKSDDDK